MPVPPEIGRACQILASSHHPPRLLPSQRGGPRNRPPAHDRPAADDDDLRVQDVHEPGDALAEPAPRLLEDPQGDLVTLPGRLGHVARADLLVAARRAPGGGPLSRAGPLAPHRVDRASGGALPPPPGVPAAAERPAGLDDDVSD